MATGDGRGTLDPAFPNAVGWSLTVPTRPGDGYQLWEVEARYNPNVDQVDIDPEDWSGVFQAGAEGPAGEMGRTGNSIANVAFTPNPPVPGQDITLSFDLVDGDGDIIESRSVTFLRVRKDLLDLLELKDHKDHKDLLDLKVLLVILVLLVLLEHKLLLEVME